MPALNVQADLRARLEKALGVSAYVNVPSGTTEKRPKTFLVVRRNGGHRINRFQDRPGVDVYSYAPTEAKAAALAAKVSDFMIALPRTAFMDGYELCAEETLGSDPDMDGLGPRWYASYTLTTHKK